MLTYVFTTFKEMFFKCSSLEGNLTDPLIDWRAMLFEAPMSKISKYFDEEKGFIRKRAGSRGVQGLGAKDMSKYSLLP